MTNCCEAAWADMVLVPPLTVSGTIPPAPGCCTRITGDDALVVLTRPPALAVDKLLPDLAGAAEITTL